MNDINFLGADNFPLSSDVMDFLKEMTRLAGRLAAIGGNNYVLSGCQADGSGNISSGIMVVDGEIMPFAGWSSSNGTPPAKLTVEQTTKMLSAFGVDYPNAQIIRVAKLSAGGAYNFSDFLPFSSNLELSDRIVGDAPGIVKMWAGLITRIHPDYRLANGDILSIDAFPALFENIGTQFGGDGVNSFALPDLRGRFIAGYDIASTDYNQNGKTGGEKEHTLTTAEMPAHSHQYELYKTGGIDMGRYSITSNRDSPTNDVFDTTMTGGGQPHENRPPFFTLCYIIKVR